MADTASFSGAMKTKFIGPIRDNLHAGKVLLFGGDAANPTGFQGIQRSAEHINFVGNEFRIPLKTKRNPAVGFRSENQVLPAPGASGYTYLTEPLRYAYALFNLTGQLMKAAESNEGAFASAFRTEMEDTVLASKLDHNRAAYGDGTGQLAVSGAAAMSATTVTVDTTINFRTGEIVDFTTSGGTVISAAHTITGVNRATKTLTFSPGLTAAITGGGTHFPVKASSDSTIAVPNNSLNKEIQGLASIVAASGTLHSVNPTTYPFWKSYADATGGAISDAKLRALKDNIGFESGADLEGSNGFVIITTRGIRSRYSDTLTGVKRFTNQEATKLRGGLTALWFDENPIFVDDQCPVGRVYGLTPSSLFWAEDSDWEWMDEDGKVLKWESRYDRYIAVLFKYTQLGTTARNKNGVLTGITDDSR